MRVVVDTNILISALVNSKGHGSSFYKLWLGGKFDLIMSEWQLEEIRRVSHYARLKDQLKPHQVGALVNKLRESAVVLKTVPAVYYSPDPDDNNIIGAALAGRAHYIVSGDKRDVQVIKKVQGVRILTVREFLGRFMYLG